MVLYGVVLEDKLGRKAREAIREARTCLSQGGYNAGYLYGYADALKEIAEMDYYAIYRDDGRESIYEWLTSDEAAELIKQGLTVRKS